MSKYVHIPMSVHELARRADSSFADAHLWRAGHAVVAPAVVERLKLEDAADAAIGEAVAAQAAADHHLANADAKRRDACVSDATISKLRLSEVKAEWDFKRAQLKGSADAEQLRARADAIQYERVKRTDAARAEAEAAVTRLNPGVPFHAGPPGLPPKVESLESKADALFGKQPKPYTPEPAK